MQRVEVHNWFGSITSSPHVVVEVESVDEIVAIVKDRERYPSPVRAVGSNHSTTPCGVAEGGTLIVMRKMDRIRVVSALFCRFLHDDQRTTPGVW